MIAQGHDAAALGGYTRRQIELYYREAAQREACARADRIEDIAAALNAKDVPKITRALRAPYGKKR